MKRVYNRVMDDRSGVCPLGELLTDKELERMRLHSFRRDWPNTAKVILQLWGTFCRELSTNKTGRMNNKRTYKTRLTNNEIMTYKELRKQQQARFNKLPMKAAFGDKQFEDMMKSWGLTTSERDRAKVMEICGGAYCLKSD